MLECAVLIPSIDRFACVWPPALECLKRYWPDRPWPVFTSSEMISWGECHVRIAEGEGFPAAVGRVLDKINTEFVLLTLEDMLLCEPVSTMHCLTSLEVMQNTPNLGGILLGPGPQQAERIHNSFFGRIHKGEPYRISCSPTLWRVEYLRKVLVGDSAWEFELEGTVKSNTLDDEIWRTIVPPPHHVIEVLYTAVTRGKWEEGALDWLKRVGIVVEPKLPIKGYEKGQRWPKVKE